MARCTFATSAQSNEGKNRKERPEWLILLTFTKQFKECNGFAAVGERFELIFGHTASSLYLLWVTKDNRQCCCIAVEYSRVEKKIQ